ncbi:MAG: trichohyalin-plectin-homology domain domain-containing protein [Clostridia bacterium]|nr:trichohyalin-plectin-homology domain domain-containing protein [Clostridia bacterium]
MYANASGNVINFGGTSGSAYVGRGVFVEFEMCVTVPAKERYTVDYSIVYQLQKRTSLKSSAVIQIYNYGFSNDTVTAPTAKSKNSKLDVPTDPNSISYATIDSSTNVLSAKTATLNNVVYENDTSHDQEFRQRLVCWSGEGYGSGTYYGTCTVNSAVTKVEKLNFDIPTDISTIYDGSDFHDITSSVYADSGWYVANGMEFTFPATPTEYRDAGTYENISVAIKQDMLNAGVKWEDDSVNDKIFKLTVNKKSLTLKEFQLDGDYKLVGALELDDTITDNVIYGRDDGKVTFKLKYKKTDNSYDSYEVPSVLKGGAGNYTAVAEMTDTSGNYSLVACSKAFTIGKKSVTLPVLEGSNSKPYDDGNDVEFVFSGVTDFVEIVAPGMTVGAVDQNGYCTLTATAVDTYPVTFKLKDVNNMEWVSDGTNGSKTLAGGLEITPKTAVLTVATDDGSWSWEKDTAKDIEITVGLVSAADLPNLTINLTYSKTGTAPKTITAIYDPVSGKYKATIPGLKQIANDYTLTVALAAGGNYTGTAAPKTFEITGTVAPFDEQYLVWRYTVDGKQVEMNDFVYDNGVVQLGYTGSEYEFSVDEDALLNITGNGGVTVSVKVSDKGFTGDKKATNVKTNGDGTYTVTVWIEAYDINTVFPETPFELTYKINPQEFDTNKLVWVYQYLGDTGWTKYDSNNPPEDKTLKVTLNVMYEDGGKLQPLPNGLTAKYLGNTLGGKGTAEATAKFTCSDTNYKVPDDMVLNWEVTSEVINIVWNEEASLEDEDGVYYTPLLTQHEKYKNVLKYEYVRTDTGESGFGFEALKKFWEDAGSTTMIPVRVTVSLVDGAEDNYVLRGTDNCDFEVGDTKTRATLTVEATGWYFEMQLSISLKQDGGKEVNPDFYNVVYYKDGEAVENFDVNTADAGEYQVGIIFNSPYDEQFVRVAKKSFVIEEKPIDIPEISEITFTGYDIDLTEYFSEAFKKLIEDGVVTITAGASQRNAGGWTAYLELAKNYKWNIPEDGGKSLSKLALAADEAEPVINGSELELPWTINRAKLVSNWDLKGKAGAKNTALSAWQNKINDGTVAVGLDYKYFDNSKVQLSEVVFKSGETLFVSAFLTGDDKDNFEFEGGIGETKQESAMVEYKVPKSGVEAALSTVKDFATKTWLGLPIWAWLLIALALIILLIIIIVVAKKQAKTKEQREEIKARKEEEKQRREDERRMQQERLQAERELAMAKQQAELEKIRAQAQAGMAGASMATMAMQQPAQQQPVQQPMQMQQQAMPTPMQVQMPQPQMQSYPQMQGYDGGMMARVMEELAAIRAEQKNKTEAELANAKLLVEFERLRGDMKQYGGMNMNGMQNGAIPANVVIALLEAVKNGNVAPISINTAPAPVAEIPQNVEESTAISTPTMYPADAVITTTTTVDTTKKTDSATIRREREDTFADVDGFYDSID